jgi:hypothetical protein
MAVKKKVSTRVRKSSSPKRVLVRSKKWALLGILILVLTIPMTIALVAQSQDIRQQAAQTQVNSINITTVPNDILKISISQEEGTRKEDADSGEQNENGEGSKECTTEDIADKTTGGMMRTINITCDGQDQTVDKSGSDGTNEVIKSGGKDGNIDKTPRDRTKNPKKNTKGKTDNRNWIQQFIDRILGRQGR